MNISENMKICHSINNKQPIKIWERTEVNCGFEKLNYMCILQAPYRI